MIASGVDIRARDGKAPDVFSRDGCVPMRQHRNTDAIDVVVIGTGAGGGVMAAKLAEAGLSVVAFDAGPFFRPLADFASDEREQEKLYWTNDRVSDGDDAIELGANNSGRAVGGSTVHFQMVALRFRPEWFQSRSRLGYARDWPVDWREMWDCYDEVEHALKISGPVTYPWGPKRRRYPYRQHELNASALVLARGAETIGVDWAPCPISTVSAPRGNAPPCVYRGFCKIGCSTNAKQSILNTYIPRALAAGAEIRDLAMVGRIETGPDGRATGVHYYRDGAWQFQKACRVIVAGYSIETPRLLLNSASNAHPYGIANAEGLVGTELMVHANHAVWGTMEDEIRWYKGPPSMAVCEHWNYDDEKDFDGGYAVMSQGPLPTDFATSMVSNLGVIGMELRRRMALYNHMAGLKIVGEVMPDPANRVGLAAQTDQLGLPVAHVTFRFGDNDRKLFNHSLRFMRRMLDAAGAEDLFETSGTAHLMGGCRMGFSDQDGVVNGDGRAFTCPNLWIADGSVMPTGGGVNPSMTIMANATRIARRMIGAISRGEG